MNPPSSNYSQIYSNLNEITMTISSLDSALKGEGEMIYVQEKNCFEPLSQNSWFPQIFSFYPKKEDTYNLLRRLEELQKKVLKVSMDLLNNINQFDDEELSKLYNEFQTITNLKIKFKECEKLFKINDNQVVKISQYTNEIFKILDNSQIALEYLLESGSGDHNEWLIINEEEDWLIIENDTILKSQSQEIAENLVSQAELYKKNLLKIFSDVNKGVIISDELIADCLMNDQLKEMFSKEDIAQANNLFSPFKNAKPLGKEDLLWKAYSIIKNDKNFIIESDTSTPTSQRDESLTESDHLSNLRIQINKEGHICVTCGAIETKTKADEFIQALLIALEQRPKNLPSKPLRIVMHQLNSFFSDHSLIPKQNVLSRYIEEQLRKILESDEEIKPFSHFLPLISHINLSFNVASILPGEDTLSYYQNLEGLTAQAMWVLEDLKNNQENPHDFSKLLQYLESLHVAHFFLITLKTELEEVSQQREDQNTIERINKQKEISDLLLQFQNTFRETLIQLSNDCLELSQEISEPSLSLSKIRLKVLGLILAKQTQSKILELLPINFNRITELELHLLLDDSLGLITEINCKSGLDRTGIARSIWDALQSLKNDFHEKFAKEGLTSDEIQTKTFEKLVQFIMDQELLITELDDIQKAISEKFPHIIQNLGDVGSAEIPHKSFRSRVLKEIQKKYREDEEKLENLKNTLKYQDQIAVNMFSIAQPITIESTGAAGLKYGQDSGLIKSLFSNPHPFKRIPMFLTTSEGKTIQLYVDRTAMFSDEAIFVRTHILTEAGKTLFLRLSSKRGV